MRLCIISKRSFSGARLAPHALPCVAQIFPKPLTEAKRRRGYFQGKRKFSFSNATKTTKPPLRTGRLCCLGTPLVGSLDEGDAHEFIGSVGLWHEDVERAELAIELVDATPAYVRAAHVHATSSTATVEWLKSPDCPNTRIIEALGGGAPTAVTEPL